LALRAARPTSAIYVKLGRLYGSACVEQAVHCILPRHCHHEKYMKNMLHRQSSRGGQP